MLYSVIMWIKNEQISINILDTKFYSLILKKKKKKCLRKKAFGENNIICVTQFVNDRNLFFYKIAFRFVYYSREFVLQKIFIILRE